MGRLGRVEGLAPFSNSPDQNILTRICATLGKRNCVEERELLAVSATCTPEITANIRLWIG